MKISKAKVVIISMLAVIYFLLFGVMPYLTRVSSHPIDYYRFRQDVRMGYIEVANRDSTYSGEVIILENLKDGMRYRITHSFPSHEEFSEPEEEVYEYLKDANGKFICYKDDDEDVLKFLKTKTVKQ